MPKSQDSGSTDDASDTIETNEENVITRVSSNGRRAAVVVIGDVGHSPRIANHALSLADEMGYEVRLIGYAETTLPSVIQDNDRVNVVPLPPPPSSICNKLPELFALVFRFLWTATVLLWILLFRMGWGLDLILVQNPPALPAMVVAWLASRLRCCVFIVDWHNYTWSMLADRWNISESQLELDYRGKRKTVKGAKDADSGAKNTTKESKGTKKKGRKNGQQRYVEWTHWLEGLFGRAADGGTCVSRAMKDDLYSRWGVNAIVFYDRPPKWKFKEVNMNDKHELFMKLSKKKEVYKGTRPIDTKEEEFSRITISDGTPRMRDDRPFIVVSSTSWTPDEDFSILLEAIRGYDQIARMSRNSTPEYSLPRILLIITGKGPEKEYYVNEMERSSMLLVDTDTPWLDADDYPTLLACADIGVSLHTSTSGLDLPMKVVDMFGSGIPVLAKRFAAIGELVKEGKNGHIFDTPKELTRHLVRLATGHPLNNKDLAKLRDFVGSDESLQSWEESWRSTVKVVIKEEWNEIFERVMATE